MSTLFDTDNRNAGFHLKHLEIYNWGTFHDRIYRLAPQGLNSLLTGANGSGKTTVVDAIITLLVPPAKRHYNQSSGADRKKERDELSYFMGAYGNIRDEDSLGGATQFLRTKDDYSILLATFTNESYQQEVTLAQVRWYSAGVFKRLYILSNSGMEIERDLIPFDGGPQWKKRLSSHHPVKYFDSFALYGQAFSALFGFRSDKALSLFSHTVGVKVLGDLNEFIRENMLDVADMEEDFAHLRKNYEDLLGAHKQIEKAREQLRLLTPVYEKRSVWEDLKLRKERSEQVFEAIPPVFAVQTLALLKNAGEKEEVKLISFDNRRLDLEVELDGLRRRERDLEFSLRDNKLADVLATIEREEDHAKAVLETKKKRAGEYNDLARGLGLPEFGAEAGFWEVREEAAAQKRQLEERLPLLQNTWADLRQTLRGLDERRSGLEGELLSLEQRSSQVPLGLVKLRDRLAADLDVSPEDLPFLAELVRVKDETWRPLAEYLLRFTALSVLVKAEDETRARAWLLERELTDTLRLFVLRNDGEEQLFVQDSKGLLSDVLEVKKGGPEVLGRWLKRNFDYLCCEELEDFLHTSRALLVSGVIRDGKLFERPTAEVLNRPADWVLGWDNADKIRVLQKQLHDLRQEQAAAEGRLNELEAERTKLDERRIGFEKFLAFQNFGELAWQREAEELERLAARKAELSSGSTDLEALQNQLADLRLKIRDKGRDKDEVIAQISRLKKSLEEYDTEERENKELLLNYAHLDVDAARELMEPYLRKVNRMLDLENIHGIREDVHKYVAAEKKTLTEELKVLERELELAMHRYINPGTELLGKFPEWSGEVTALMAKTDYLGEFAKIYDRVLKEDLPGYQQRFKDWLNQRLLEDIADFKTSLENYQRGILESIRELNASLKTITYNSLPPTYIQIHTEESRDIQIRDFRKMLREALQLDADGDLEKSFHKIRAIIQSLSENEDWRRKVTDVRNWLQFSAMELYQADGAQRQYYQDSQSLSGGEKAKLAYTILASAIAHQFGIRRDGVASRSFRFAVVDEAFSKVDPENSKFAMNLFEQLDLQLMVVTPLDKINVVEDYIHTIHYVENKRRKTSSVYDLAIKDYRALQQAAGGQP